MTEIVTPVPITPMPAAPLLTDTQSVFNTKAFAFVAAWDAFVAQMNAVAAATRTNAVAGDERAVSANTSSVSAANSATAAGSARDMAQAFAQSAVNAPGTSGTSPSSIAIGSGNKVLTTQTGKAFVPGQTVTVAATASPTGQRMVGVITSYDAGTGVMNFFVSDGAFLGSGAPASWIISLTSARDGLVQQGTGVGQGANAVKLGWASDGSGRLLVTVDSTNLGALLFDSHGLQLSPPGMFGFFFQNAPPAGWLKANGAAVSRTTYARLFAAIGTYYGAGDGSTTFNLPEMRGIFPRTWDDGRGVDAGRGFGSYQAPQNQYHNHAAWSDGAGQHSHGDWTGAGGTHAHTGATYAAGAHGHTVNQVRSAGGGGGPNSLKSEDSAGSPIATSSVGDHAHTLAIDASGYHNHQIVADGYHAHGIGIHYEGGEARPHNVALLGCIRY